MSDNEEYKGPGKFTAALGRAHMESVIGAVAGATVGAGIAAITHQNVSTVLGELERDERLLHIFTGALNGGVVGSLAGTIDGAYHGFQNAKAGEQQFRELKSENKAFQKGYTALITAQKESADKTPSK